MPTRLTVAWLLPSAPLGGLLARGRLEDQLVVELVLDDPEAWTGTSHMGRHKEPERSLTVVQDREIVLLRGGTSSPGRATGFRSVWDGF